MLHFSRFLLAYCAIAFFFAFVTDFMSMSQLSDSEWVLCCLHKLDGEITVCLHTHKVKVKLILMALKKIKNLVI